MNDQKKFRLFKKFFLFFLFFLFFIGLYKAFTIQILKREKLQAYLKGQILEEVTIYPDRGGIYDRMGHPLALTKKTYSLFTYPKQLENFDTTWKKLGEIIPSLKANKNKNEIKNRNRFTWIARHLDLSNGQIQDLKNISGIYIDEEKGRFYSNVDLAKNIIGAVDLDNRGIAGIEYKFDDILRGAPSIVRYFKDAKGRPFKGKGKEFFNKADHIYLSLSKDLQAMIEMEVKKTIYEYDALGGGAAIIDAKTGEIWGMTSFLRQHLDEELKNSTTNFFLSHPFEPGSTFKAVTIAMGLEEKIINEKTPIYCEHGQFEIDKKIITEAESKRFDWLSVEEILMYSSNIGVAKLALQMGPLKIKKYLQEWKFDAPTGIELAGESKGIISLDENWGRLKLATIGFGQGISLNALQLLSFYQALANDGLWVRPTFLKQDNNNKVKEEKRFFSKETASVLKKMLEKVVESGTGKKAQIQNFRIAGKTSTAQWVHKGKYEGYLSGFTGMPLYIKRPFVVTTYIIRPSQEYYGGVVAAPLFKKITEMVLFKNKEYDSLMNFASQTDQPKKEIKEKELTYHLSSVSKNVEKSFKGNTVLVPDFIGKDRIEAKKINEQLKMPLKEQGIGIVFSQFPKPLTPYQKGMAIRLYYKIPEYENN